MFTVNCQIQSITPINYDIYRVFLALPANKPIRYYAGQYLEILLSPESACPFSIANKPDTSGLIELHIREFPDREFSSRVIKYLQQNHTVNVRLPMGKCFINNIPDNPLILLAASTGFSQIKCIAEYLLTYNLKYPLYLYRGVNSTDDLYLNELALSWQQQYVFLHYIPVVNANDPHWHGRTGLLYQAVLQDHKDLSDFHIYASGGPGGIYAALDAFCDHNLNRLNFHSDVLEYAPRN